MQTLKLTDAKLRTLTQPGKHFDGAGLYIEVAASGGPYWRLKYRIAGKEKRLALGVYPAVSLKQARDQADAARKALQGGDDPGELRRVAKLRTEHEARNTFEAVARDWMTHQGAKWAPVTLERIRSTLEADIFPLLGLRPMASLKPRDLMDAVKRIEKRGAGDQATRTLQRVKAVFRYAVTHERIDSNPMLDVVPSEVLKARQVTHRPALADRDLPEFLAKLDAYQGDPHTVHALRLLILTAVRPGEVRGARWAEFDLDAAQWRIPAGRMKMKAEHLVPLSRQALALLAHMQPLSGGGELVFPSPFYPGKSLSENTLNSALARMGYKGQATAHGFRSLFSTVANECGWNPDAIERQLAHVERNDVRAAYHRATYHEERGRLVQWWADYLDGRRSGKVLKMKARAA